MMKWKKKYKPKQPDLYGQTYCRCVGTHGDKGWRTTSYVVATRETNGFAVWSWRYHEWSKKNSSYQIRTFTRHEDALDFAAERAFEYMKEHMEKE